MNPAAFRWNIVQPTARKITQATLDRGAVISAELAEKAQAAMKRLAMMPEDDPSDGEVIAEIP
jgi:hypothetical protein